MGLITAYAPHNMKSLADRLSFYYALDNTYRICKANVGKVVAGDFNARIGQQGLLEDDVLGDYCFGCEALHKVDSPTRDLLLEFCLGSRNVVANTFVDAAPDCKVTYRSPGTQPMYPIGEHNFQMLDLILCQQPWLNSLYELRSVRETTLASDHFLVKFASVFATNESPALQDKLIGEVL